MIDDKGFTVKPEYYTQEQWCRMYLTVIRIYKNLYEEHEQLKKELNALKMSEEEWLEETIGHE